VIPDRPGDSDEKPAIHVAGFFVFETYAFDEEASDFMEGTFNR
jgi:hypothetical protein